MGAEGFHGRVRDGIGWFSPRYGHQAVDPRRDFISGDPLSPFGLLERVPEVLFAGDPLSPFGLLERVPEVLFAGNTLSPLGLLERVPEVLMTYPPSKRVMGVCVMIAVFVRAGPLTLLR